MTHLKTIEQVKDELPQQMESEHFVVHFGLRNPRSGRGLGPGGVGDPVLVRTYLSALERLYRTLKSPPWNREEPVTDASGKTCVYVCDLAQIGFTDPVTVLDRDGVPYIGLPCRSREPLTDAVFRRAAAEAVHEATHVFNAQQRPFDAFESQWWAWLDEAIATYMESRVLPGNQDYFRFLPDWIDHPGVSLNDWRAAYQACLFLHYLSGTLGPEFLNRVWIEAQQYEKPLEVIRRLMPKGWRFADPAHRDLFASGYAVESYFLRDHGSGCFAPEICSRFGDRAVAESCVISRGEVLPPAVESLPHLASHYFRIYPHRNVRRLRVELRAGIRNDEIPFKAEVIVVNSDLSPGKRQVLRSRRASRDGTPPEPLVAEVTGLGRIDLQHLVVVVSNCTCEELPIDHKLPAADRYEIEISAG